MSSTGTATPPTPSLSGADSSATGPHQTVLTIPESPTTAPPTSKQSWRDVVFAQLYKHWFLLGLGLAIGLARAFPTVGKKGGPIRAEWSIKWGAVCIIFFISGLSLRTKVLIREIVRVRLHALVQIISLVIIPFVVYGIIELFRAVHVPIDGTLLSGIVIAASTPTTVSSNVVMTKNGGGNEAAALMNAALGNILGIFVSPALVYLFLHDVASSNSTATSTTFSQYTSGPQLDYISVLENLGATVLAPLVVGQVIQTIWPDTIAKWRAKFRLGDINSLCLLLLVWSVFCDTFASDSFAKIHASDLVAVLVIDAILYVGFSALAWFLARLPIPFRTRRENGWVEKWRFSREDTVAIMYCGATKTVSMGVPLINVLYSGGDPGVIGVLSTPLLMYHVEQLIIGSAEVTVLKRWVEKGKREDEMAREAEQRSETVEGHEEEDLIQ
ncbi:SBF-like CPA transporter family-domain-containing protein [Jimgerdemannia flammicorona]|uniref:SBF-like CPA transporter family-domain-containing protein n=1 Tax=Jimgerdemannia flammicorona TaxID=994334 RepID=A0A433A2K9_9FUNG|nr:SBF-like CPA transporter family-domain-containing protein [Jimgerdemannia flammicorona]